jgi:glucose-6-phosphate 1-epimerase
LIELDTSEGAVRVVQQGAHVTQWQPRGGEPVLFMSPRSVFAPGRAIRGGIPVCFPWFGARADTEGAPAHGFARVRDWRLAERTPTSLRFTLESDAETHRLWPHDFRLRLDLALSESVELALEVTNTSSSTFTFEAALHTYLSVGDVGAISIIGLERAPYVDKTEGDARKRADPGPMRLAGEVDRVFPGTTATCVVDDPVLRRRLRVAKRGSATTVIWNPGPARAATLADLGSDAWRTMVCVETANAGDDRVRLPAGAVHRMSTTLSCE